MQAPIVARLKQRHRFDEWAGRNMLAQSLFIYGYFPQDDVLPDWRVIREQDLAVPNAPPRVHTIWVQAETETERLLKMDVYPCPSREDAHDFVVRLLGNFQSPLIELRPDLPIGDIAFAVPGDVALVFARANLAVFVASVGDFQAPVVEFARRLDEQLSERPTTRSTRARPMETRRLVIPKSIRSKARFSLDMELPEPAKERSYWKFFSGSGDVMLSNGRLVYQARETGTGQVDAFEIPPDRAATPRRMTIQIESSNS